jgi:hypothetical protein
MEFFAFFILGTTTVLLAAQAIDALKREEPVQVSKRWRMLDNAAKLWDADRKPRSATITHRADAASPIRSVGDLGCHPPRVGNALKSFGAATNDMWPRHERQSHKRAYSCATTKSGP